MNRIKEKQKRERDTSPTPFDNLSNEILYGQDVTLGNVRSASGKTEVVV